MLPAVLTFFLTSAKKYLRTLAALCMLTAPFAALAAPFAYISNSLSNTVSVIDTASNAVTATIAVGGFPSGVSVNPAGTQVYVANTVSNTVSVIDTASNTVIATIPVGGSPYGISINPAGTRVYVANSATSTVSVIDTASNTLTATITVGSNPHGVLVNSAGTLVYVANSSSNTVSIINTATDAVIATIALGRSPSGLSINPAGTSVYVTTYDPNSAISVIDTATSTVTRTINIGDNAFGASFNPAGTRVYVTKGTGNSIAVIDTATNTVTASIAVGSYATGVSVNPAGTRVYVINGNSNTVSVIDATTNTVTATIAVGKSPIAYGNFIATGIVAPPVIPDPAPIPTLAITSSPGIGVQPAVLDLSAGQGPAMTNCLLATVRALLGSDAQYLGQGTNGVAKFSQGGHVISFYPLAASSDTGLSANLHLTSSNVLNIGTSCGNFSVVPAISNPANFGSILKGINLQAGIGSQGVVTVSAGSATFVGRPDYLVASGAATTLGLTQGTDGLYRFTDGAGNVQILYPAFVDTNALAIMVPRALSQSGEVLIQTDGTALFSTSSGVEYVLTPDLTLTTPPAANSALTWWQDTPGHFVIRSTLLTPAQGFTAKVR